MDFNLSSFAVLWSQQQNVFHIQTVSEMIAANRRIFDSEEGASFVVLKITKTKEDAVAISNHYQKIRDERVKSSRT